MTLLHPIAPDDRLLPFAHFVAAFTDLVGARPVESEILARGRRLLEALVADDAWLPDSHVAADPHRYQQHLLYHDPDHRFSVVSFVWGPGQATPIHDHRIWGLVGVLRGAELVEGFRRDADGALRSTGAAHRLERGQVDAVSPRIGDIHRVANGHDDRVSISIHVYGADIGAVQRATFDGNGHAAPFVSGYSAVPAVFA